MGHEGVVRVSRKDVTKKIIKRYQNLIKILIRLFRVIYNSYKIFEIKSQVYLICKDEISHFHENLDHKLKILILFH